MIKALIILFRIFFIFSWYRILYLFNNDYQSFIFNITNKLSKINILYIKLFQAIAFNYKLIDTNLNNELIKFTDKAPWTEEDIDYNTLLRLRENEKINLDIPIHSGMISLVYKITTENNESFAIKIKRKNIDYKLKKAVEELLIIIKFISQIYFIKEYNLYDLSKTHFDIITKQLDFNEEVNNLIKMKENCKRLKYIVIPKVYPDITQKYSNVIIMEYLKGVSLQEIPTEDYDFFAKQVFKFGIVTTYYHGFTHSDLHAGNILFIKNENSYKLGILDFGMILSIDNDYKYLLFELLYDIYESDPYIMAKKILDSEVILQPKNIIQNLSSEQYNILLEMIVQLLKDTILNKQKNTYYCIYDFIIQFHNYIHKYSIFSMGISLNHNFIKTQLVLVMYHGIFMKLCKDNWLDIFNKTINEMFHMDLLNELRSNFKNSKMTL
jgi:predicted unusual protein kinase regulating ubiquinone biosynthesis (AarF/ABC1/UbiB family)